jgi:hypothetical protein
MGTTDVQRHHYTGRVYSPTFTFSLDGSSATLIFSGYNTGAPRPCPLGLADLCSSHAHGSHAHGAMHD